MKQHGIPSLGELAAGLLPAVLQAGRVELGYFRSGVEVVQKADQSPVTAADHEAEAILVRALREVAPQVPVIAEEEMAAGLRPGSGRALFLVDPLDGTREFISGRDEFTINIGLVVDGQPVFGIVYAPARGSLFLTRAPGEAVEVRVQPHDPLPDIFGREAAVIRTRAPDRAALVALQSRSRHNEEGEALLRQLGVTEVRRLGSSLKLCLIARGEADLYVRHGDTSEWDTAAGHAVLRAAGGRVTNFAGEELVYGRAEHRFINPHFVAWGRNPLK